MYQSGNTLRLECTFKGYDGAVVSPSLAKCRIYNYKKERIEELGLNKVGDKYQCHYTPAVTGTYYAEFYGEEMGRPILVRKKFEVSFE